jgi:hypothetical protein
MADLNLIYTKLSGYYDLTHHFKDYRHLRPAVISYKNDFRRLVNE